jgi:7-cyano-7-deazaguanine synthase
MKQLDKNKALVCLSGGQDSTACLLYALQVYNAVYTVSFDYGQKHSVELDCAREIAEILEVAGHSVLYMPALKQIGDSALLTNADMNAVKDGLPASFVPGRNIIFLSQAAALAYKLDCGSLVTGVNEADLSGYPDCREQTMKLLEAVLSAGMETNLEIVTPLMHKTKAEVWAIAYQYRLPPYDKPEYGVELIREYTHTCYNGECAIKHEWGYGCGDCPACRLRRSGYEEFISGLEK